MSLTHFTTRDGKPATDSTCGKCGHKWLHSVARGGIVPRCPKCADEAVRTLRRRVPNHLNND